MDPWDTQETETAKRKLAIYKMAETESMSIIAVFLASEL
jgi:hypothetical protein